MPSMLTLIANNKPKNVKEVFIQYHCFKTELIDASLEYWINHNYLVAQGLREGEEFESEGV